MVPWDGGPFIIILICCGYLLGPIIPYDAGCVGMSKWSDPSGRLFHPLTNWIYWGYNPLTLPSRKFTYPHQTGSSEHHRLKYAKNLEHILIPWRVTSDPNFRPGTCILLKGLFPINGFFIGFFFTPKKGEVIAPPTCNCFDPRDPITLSEVDLCC